MLITHDLPTEKQHQRNFAMVSSTSTGMVIFTRLQLLCLRLTDADPEGYYMRTAPSSH